MENTEKKNRGKFFKSQCKTRRHWDFREQLKGHAGGLSGRPRRPAESSRCARGRHSFQKEMQEGYISLPQHIIRPLRGDRSAQEPRNEKASASIPMSMEGRATLFPLSEWECRRGKRSGGRNVDIRPKGVVKGKRAKKGHSASSCRPDTGRETLKESRRFLHNKGCSQQP